MSPDYRVTVMLIQSDRALLLRYGQPSSPLRATLESIPDSRGGVDVTCSGKDVEDLYANLAAYNHPDLQDEVRDQVEDLRKYIGRKRKPVSSRPQDSSLKAEPQIRCAKCNSTQITANKKGFGLGKAVAGGFLLGPVGLLGGTIGSSKVKVTCLACGHEWKPGEG
jgi:hypothetical protein